MADENLFVGLSEHCCDQKNRVVLSAKFRKRLGGRIMLTYGLEGCLYLFPLELWKEFFEGLRARTDEFRRDARRLRRFFGAHAEEVKVDSQGRMLIPARLKEYAGIGRELVFVGVGDRIEVWDKEKWRSEEGDLVARAEEIAESVGGSGYGE